MQRAQVRLGMRSATFLALQLCWQWTLGWGGSHWLKFATPWVYWHGLDRLPALGPCVRIATCIECSHGMVLGLLLGLNRAVPGGERDGAVLLA